ncbi:SpoIID/LytB domain-containing protein, partial [bacterium]|nr:SpoIID/LytB domain-containing protein [bacterium]
GLMAFLILLPAVLSANTPVSISILSVLRPTEITITLIEPERAVLKLDGSQSILLSNDPLNVKLVNERLITASKSFSHLSLSCSSTCTMDLNVPAKIARSYRGGLDLSVRLDAINIVLQASQEELIGSISASEMGEFGEAEALEAFAVVSRSFLQAGRRHPDLRADFCDLTHCQVFQSYTASLEALQSVEKTHGLILTFQQKPFRPYYFRSCGGKTATFEEVWRKKAPDYPFASVQCPCNSTWEARLNVSQLQAAAGFPLTMIQQDKNQIQLSSENRKISYSLEEFRNVVGKKLGWNKIKSNSFQATQQGIDLLVTGRGIGHRVGFCQNGAFQMARSGKTFHEILQHYFPNAEIRAVR